MEKGYTYQRDTTKLKLPLKSIPDLQESGGLRIKRVAPVSIEPIRTRETVEQKTDTAEQVYSPPPTMAQIRYRQWQREQNIRVGDSRYISSRNEIQIVSVQDSAEQGLILPSHKVSHVNTDWITLLLLFSLVLFATIRNKWAKYVGNLFRSLVNYSTANRMFREKNFSVLHAAFRLDLYFYLIFPLFIYQIIHHFNIHFPYESYRLYFIVMGTVLVYFLCKKMLYKFIGVLFENTSDTREFLFNLKNFNRVGIVAVIAFFPFSNMIIPVSIGIMIVLFGYFLLLFRGILILLKKQFSLIYLFLYFCILEFLPLVLVYKILLR